MLKKGGELFAYLVDKWEKRKSKNYNLVISNEEIVRDNFRKVIGHDKAEVLYNFSDNYNLFTEIPLDDKTIDFIYSGGITKLRGAFKILEATKLIVKERPNVKVVFVGRYSPENLKNEMQNFIDRNNLKNNVELHSFVNYSEISEYYNNSKIGLVTLLNSPTFQISMPIKIFEYMAFGLPIIGSDFGHIKEYIEKENCGITVNPESVKDISNAMIQLLTDKKMYKLCSENGRFATLKKYKWEFEFERLIGFYKRELNRR